MGTRGIVARYLRWLLINPTTIFEAYPSWLTLIARNCKDISDFFHNRLAVASFSILINLRQHWIDETAAFCICSVEKDLTLSHKLHSTMPSSGKYRDS
jgi:hypothetical protein